MQLDKPAMVYKPQDLDMILLPYLSVERILLSSSVSILLEPVSLSHTLPFLHTKPFPFIYPDQT